MYSVAAAAGTWRASATNPSKQRRPVLEDWPPTHLSCLGAGRPASAHSACGSVQPLRSITASKSAATSSWCSWSALSAAQRSQRCAVAWKAACAQSSLAPRSKYKRSASRANADKAPSARKPTGEAQNCCDTRPILSRLPGVRGGLSGGCGGRRRPASATKPAVICAALRPPR